MVKAICQTCEKEFFARAYQIKIGTGKYCSAKCRGKGVNKPIPVEDRILKFIDIKGENECWEFTGFKNKNGYGKIGISNGKVDSAHRVMYKIYNGNIPEDMVIMHTCDNPACCNPKHLVLGTQNDNIKDMISKGRFVPRNTPHKLTEEQMNEIRNKYTGKRGGKVKLAKEYNVVVTTITNILNNEKNK
jgi:hypothetical protein